MSLRKKFFAATYDSFSRKAEEAGLRDMRHGLLAEAGGSVLEIGAGTGANRAHYIGHLESLVFTDDSDLASLADPAADALKT